MSTWAEDRFPSVALGYAAASVAAGLSMILQPLVISSPHKTEVDTGYVFMLGAFAIVFSTIYAAPFAAVLIYLAERWSIRSVFYYAIGGVITGVLVVLAIRLGYDANDLGTFRLVSVGGFIAGLVYWFMAGRHAGREA